jgi:hypothetical protein
MKVLIAALALAALMAGPTFAGELVIRVERLLTERPRKPADVAPSGYGRDSGRFRFAPRTWLARGRTLPAEWIEQFGRVEPRGERP